MDYTVHGILQARILEWVAFPFSKGSSQPRDQTQVSRIAGGFFTSWATWKPKNTGVSSLSLLQWIFWPRNWTRVSCIAGKYFTNWAIREAPLFFFLLLWYTYSYIKVKEKKLIIIVVAVVESLSCMWLFRTPWTVACQAPPSSIISQSLLKFMSIELVILSNHLILHWPLLLLPSIFPSIRVF